MIAEKIIPSFYVIETDGDAADLAFLFGKDFGIARVAIASGRFDTDIMALEAATNAVNLFLRNPKVNGDKLTESIKYNPDFYPNLPSIELTAEQKREKQEIQDHIDSMTEMGQMRVPLSHDFDDLGDFVSSKIMVTGAEANIVAKILSDKDVYVETKKEELEASVNTAGGPHREKQPEFRVH